MLWHMIWLQKMKNPQFIATLHTLHSILPQLAHMSMAFQGGNVNFCHIEPTLRYTKDALKAPKTGETGETLEALKIDLTPAC